MRRLGVEQERAQRVVDDVGIGLGCEDVRVRDAVLDRVVHLHRVVRRGQRPVVTSVTIHIVLGVPREICHNDVHHAGDRDLGFEVGGDDLVQRRRLLEVPHRGTPRRARLVQPDLDGDRVLREGVRIHDRYLRWCQVQCVPAVDLEEGNIVFVRAATRVVRRSALVATVGCLVVLRDAPDVVQDLLGKACHGDLEVSVGVRCEDSHGAVRRQLEAEGAPGRC
mmetsp:Transcript_22191/g.76147  ORF Transcript_22191/g.76147 Transcript_22191/m.76147 type:complete len:222 (+) Transcript_22191:822-1487(+)